MKKLEALIASLPIIENIDGVQTAPDTFLRPEEPNRVRISAEHKYSHLFLDYYADYRGGYPWIHPALLKWAEDHKGYWEWDNPSSIAFYED